MRRLPGEEVVVTKGKGELAEVCRRQLVAGLSHPSPGQSGYPRCRARNRLLQISRAITRYPKARASDLASKRAEVVNDSRTVAITIRIDHALRQQDLREVVPA